MILLVIGVNLLHSILRQMIEQLQIVVHGPSAFPQVHELLMFSLHNAYREVMGAEGIMELGPQHLVLCGVSGGVVGLWPITHKHSLAAAMRRRGSSDATCSGGAQTWTR
jgi:hypothetical protein